MWQSNVLSCCKIMKELFVKVFCLQNIMSTTPMYFLLGFVNQFLTCMYIIRNSTNVYVYWNAWCMYLTSV